MTKNPQNIRHYALMLKPAVRYLARRGLKVQEIIEAVKIAMIDDTCGELKKLDSNLNISKISVATGIHRRDVIRLWRDDSAKKSNSNLISKIVGELERSKKTLSYHGNDSDFAKLVRSYSKDLNSYTILFELERAGVIEKNKNEIKLLKPEYQPSSEDIESSEELLIQDAQDLFHAVEENLYTKSSVKNLHASTQFDNIPTEYIKEIRSYLLKIGTQFQRQIRKYLEKYDRDVNKKISGSGRNRISVGVFSANNIISDDENEKN